MGRELRFTIRAGGDLDMKPLDRSLDEPSSALADQLDSWYRPRIRRSRSGYEV